MVPIIAPLVNGEKSAKGRPSGLAGLTRATVAMLRAEALEDAGTPYQQLRKRRDRKLPSYGERRVMGPDTGG